MRRLTDNTVVRHPQTGEAVLLAAGGPLPDWAEGLVGAHLLDGPKVTATPPPFSESPADERARLLARLAELGDTGGQAGPGPEPAGSGQTRDDDAPPPKGGSGSGAPAWREYAARHGVDVPADATREAIIAALEDANVRTE